MCGGGGGGGGGIRSSMHRPHGRGGRDHPTHSAEGRTGDCPGPREATSDGRNVTRPRGGGGGGRDALEGKAPQRRPQRRLGRRLEEVAKAVGGGYCRLQMPLRLALGVRGTVAGHRLDALEGGLPSPPPNALVGASGCCPGFQGETVSFTCPQTAGRRPLEGRAPRGTKPSQEVRMGPWSRRSQVLLRPPGVPPPPAPANASHECSSHVMSPPPPPPKPRAPVLRHTALRRSARSTPHGARESASKARGMLRRTGSATCVCEVHAALACAGHGYLGL